MNGTFDTSLVGWTTTKATATLVAGGIGGTNAALVTVTRSARRYSIAANASATATAGVDYTAVAFERSAVPGRKLCLTVTELAGATPRGSAQGCLASTATWQQIPAVQYTAVHSGDTLQVELQQSKATRGDSFEVDNASLTSPSVAAPSNTSPPAVLGDAVDGQTLTADPGSWGGSAPISYAYQWQSSTDGTTWSNVATGGTAQTYVPAHGDVGSLLRVLVTASNSGGSASLASPATTAVAAAAPADVTPPSIAGSEVVGTPLTASTGTWSGTPPLAFDYEWQESADGGTTWSDVGTDSDTYVPSAADLGDALHVLVTATNAEGSASAISAPTREVSVASTAPAVVTPPSVDGLAVDTGTLAVDPGTWSGTSPITFTYQWLRCAADGTGCTPVAGATGSMYRAQPADEGSTLAVTVTAANETGSASATSAPSAAVAPICGSASSATPPAGYEHVIWIWMENRSYGAIVGPPGSTAAMNSPFVNGTLVHDCGLATNYHSLSHPSLPNYIGATSGSTQGLSHNTLHHYSVTSLFDELEQAQLTWRSYQESMPTTCDPVDADPYATDHNPALDYTGIADTCPLFDIPMGDTTTGALASDLANDTLPTFSLVVPNDCDSTDSCPIASGETWLSTWLPLVVASPAFQSGSTAVFVVWDEGRGGTSGEDCLANPSDESCHVPLVVLTPYTPAGMESATLFDHYSLLATTEDMLGLPLLGGAADPATATLRADFHF